jgi:peptidoglycan/xylan/chitin deacetylase (PgdA/CDA1 family)
MRGHLIVDVPLIAAAVSLAPVYGWLPLAYITGIASGIHTWGVINPRSSLYMPVWWRLPADCPDIALTFDDGPHPEITPRLLDLLAAHQQHATFFIIGENARRYPEVVRRIVTEGHSIGLHSDRHSWAFNCWPPHLVRCDLMRCQETIAEITGQAAPLLFRPPVGLKNPIVGFVVGQLGLRTVTWSCRGLDTGNASAATIMERLQRGLHPRAILTLHDGHEPSRPKNRTICLTVVEQLLPLLQQRGLTSRALIVASNGISLRQ